VPLTIAMTIAMASWLNFWQAKPAVLAWSLSVLAHAYRLTLRDDEAIAVYKQAISLAPGGAGALSRGVRLLARPLIRVVVAIVRVFAVTEALDVRGHVGDEAHAVARAFAGQDPHRLVRL